MGEFTICCPHCGSYVKAYNGLRGMIQNHITCGNCNETIDVKSSRMINVICPSCKNSVLYDQGKKIPKCPVCNSEIKPATGKKMITIHCPTCHTAYSMSEGASEFTCSLCDSVIDVQREIAAMAANSGTTSLVEYDPGDRDWLVYKHPIKNFANGSQLIVRAGQQALLVEAGEDSHLFEKGEYTLDTANFPYLEKVYKLSDGDTRGTFQSSMYFFNLRTITGGGGKKLEWYVKKTPVLFNMLFEGSSRSTEVYFNIGCGGTYDIHITEARKLFLNLNSVAAGLNVDTFSDTKYSDAVGSLSKSLKSKINAWGGEILADTLPQLSLGIFDLRRKSSQIAEQIREKVNQYLEEFGLEIQTFVIDSFATPEDDADDPGYKDWMSFRQMGSTAAAALKAQIHEQDVQEQLKRTEERRIETDRVRELGKAEIEAEIIRMKARAKAEEAMMLGNADAAVLKAKGGNYAMETQRSVGELAMQNGLPSGGGNGQGSVIGDMVNFGMAAGMAGTVVGMTEKVMEPVVSAMNGTDSGKAPIKSDPQIGMKSSWNCPACGKTGLTTKWCPDCGTPQPEKWKCPNCNEEGITTKFCPNCGTQKPEKWTCPNCGESGLTTKFCSNCGTPKPEKKLVEWICPNCGAEKLTTKCCPNCGTRKPEKKLVEWTCPNCKTTGLTTKCCPDCGTLRPENREGESK